MPSKRLTATVAVAVAGAASIAAVPAASGAPVVTEASGANAAAIQATVDAYRNSLGVNNGTGPAQPAGRREINWDGVPDDRSAPSFMPEGQFRGRGALFTTPGIGVQVSGDDNDDAGAPDADPDQVEFANLNAGYPGGVRAVLGRAPVRASGLQRDRDRIRHRRHGHPGADERPRRRVHRRRQPGADHDRAARRRRREPRRV